LNETFFLGEEKKGPGKKDIECRKRVRTKEINYIKSNQINIFTRLKWLRVKLSEKYVKIKESRN